MEENKKTESLEESLKNDAPEKTEVKKKAKKKTPEKKSPKKSTVKKKGKKEKKSDFKKMKEEIRQRKADKKAAKKKKAAEKEKIRAEKRIELARIKAEKKAEKEKIRAEKQKDLKKKKLEAKNKKAELRAEKEKRRDIIKHETKSEKAKRIRAEKAERARIKKEKIEAKRSRAAEKEKNKQALKEARAKRRYEKQRNKQKGFGGWLAAVVTLGVTVLALGTLLTLNYLLPTEMGTGLDNNYQRSYYEFAESVNNLDLNLSKLSLSEGAEEEQRLLVDVIVESEIAQSDLSSLPLEEENKYNLSKFINQVGDYSKYLNNKLIEGKSISEEERENLLKMQSVTEQLKIKLEELNENMSDYDFTRMLNKNGDMISDKFGEMQNLSVEYPELIYDGAFSDAKTKNVLLTDGKEITKSQAEDIFYKAFSYLGKLEVVEAEKAEGKYEVYYINGKNEDGLSVFAEISVKGGKIIMFSCESDCTEAEIGENESIETAKNFLNSMGIANMTPVWQQVTGSSVTYNFAYEENDVICYNDLIKVKVCLKNNRVIGYEACSYYTNHKDRNIENPAISVDEAKGMVSGKIDIYSTRLALIPVKPSVERLAYENVGEYNGNTYYVYIDAVTGQELDIFKVINSKDGVLIY